MADSVDNSNSGDDRNYRSDLNLISKVYEAEGEYSTGKSIEERKLLAHAKRTEENENTSHKASKWGFWVVFWCSIAIVTVRVFHYILPLHCQWLVDTQIAQIDDILFSGVAGTVLGKMSNRFLKR